MNNINNINNSNTNNTNIQYYHFSNDNIIP